MSLTFAMIKPDAMLSRQQGWILSDILRAGFTIRAAREVSLIVNHVEALYAEHMKQPFWGELRDFTMSGPVVLMALELEDAVVQWRRLIGDAFPSKAAHGTLRRRYGVGVPNNAVHGSADTDAAIRELYLFFPEIYYAQRCIEAARDSVGPSSKRSRE